MSPEERRLDRLQGSLLGLALGDALGLPREGLSPRRAARLFGEGPLRHRFLFGRGMVSDDTEHACMVAQALLASGGDAEGFARSLGWRLRGWLLGLPAGIGFATLRALLKLWIGFPPTRSGVFSAGNGPAMRAPLLGACARPGRDDLAAWNRISTRITHTDPLAEEGAFLVARAAQLAASQDTDASELMGQLRAAATLPEWQKVLDSIQTHLARRDSPETFAASLGCTNGVSGFILHTVPVALYCWLINFHDARAAIEAAVKLGGDADTVAAITGGLAGATVGLSGLPADWLDGLRDAPRSRRWMEALATRLAIRFPIEGPGAPVRPLALVWPLLPLRNAFFLAVVLGHGFRRLLPPY